jgi:hypothetical protein
VNLDRLRQVFEQSGPYLTLHLDVGRTDEHGRDQIESRWTSIRHELEEAGLPEELVEEVGDSLHENTHLSGEVRRTIVAAGSRILLDSVQSGHNPHPEVVDVADLPHLAGWIDVEDQAYPFVLAVVDRTGGEVQAYRATSRPPVDDKSVIGETFLITKVSTGGWAHRKVQQRVENRWQENAALVAEAIRDTAFGHGAATVLVGGEVRARAEVVKALQHLDHGFGSVIEIESGGFAEGASEEALWAEIHERLRDLVAAGDADVSARLDEGRGRGTGVATGLDEVLDALVQGQVDTLVADLETLAERSVEPRRHEGLPLPAPAGDAERLPADRVLVAAAALTGARLRVLPASMVHGGGVSALLRWDDANGS